MNDILLVLTNLPDQAGAERVATALVEQGLVACVNILAPCQSVYRWEGKVERATEVPVLIKTRAIHYPEVELAIRQLHPYQVPEIITLPVSGGLPAYLDWVRQETEGPTDLC